MTDYISEGKTYEQLTEDLKNKVRCLEDNALNYISQIEDLKTKIRSLEERNSVMSKFIISLLNAE